MKDILEYTKEDFEKIPFIDRSVPYDQQLLKSLKFDYFVVIPQSQAHDTGFSCMAFCLFKKGKPLGKIGGCSDVIHLDGIGGYGDWNPNTDPLPKMIRPRGWNVDCLPCGYLRFFVHGHYMYLLDSIVCSDFEVYAHKKEAKDNAE